MRHAALIGALCTVFVSACSEESGPNISGINDIDITRVEISPKLDTLFVADTLRPGDRLQMQGVVIGRTGQPITSAKLAWSSSKPEVAIVDEGGMVIPTGYGSTVITASAAEVAKATIVVMPAARSVVISPAVDTIFVEDPIAARDSIRLTAKAIDENGDVVAGVAFTWASALAATATVNVAGSVTARGLGVVNVTATSGTSTGTASVRVASAVKAIQVAAPVTTVLAKDTLQVTATALGYDDKPMAGRTFTWTSSNPSVATINESGRAIFLSAGAVTFTAKSAFTTSTVTVTALERQFQRVSSGEDFTCGFTNLGRAYCWGLGSVGQLATAADSLCDFGRAGCTLAPKRASGPAIDFTAIDAGGSSGCAISADRKIYCWGSDVSGQIGNGGKGAGAGPTLATVAQERFDSITVGGAHACALTTTRLAYCWGNDAFGQLGDDRRINSTTPIPVIGGRQFSTISAGDSHTCGLSNGQAWCWGLNTKGQLGIGFESNGSDEPVAVSGGGTWIAISAGGNHTCALSQAGAAFCWGADSLDQVGGGALTAPAPVQVAGGPYTQISSGFAHTCALSASGSVSCWGWNEWAQVGNGSVSVSSPVSQVQGGHVFRSITAGTNHTCGLASDGEAYCWGSNVYGALGNELQAAYRQTPQKVAAPR